MNRQSEAVKRNLTTLLEPLGGVALSEAELRALRWLAEGERDTCEKLASVLRKTRERRVGGA